MDIDLKNIAKDIFGRYSLENVVYVTDDGQGFFNKSHAINHAKKNRKGKELKISTFERPKEEPVTVKTAKELIEILKTATAEEVADIAEVETALGDKSRKSVYAAIESRLKELETPE